MPKRTTIGVDFGSTAVRAAEVVSEGSHVSVVRFGQVGLPSGAVVEGEVRDQAAVESALKRLWSDGGFSRRDVVLGVGSQRAMVRVVEMPGISDKDLRSALRYEIGELLPIPVEQAVFDFKVLGPGKPRGDGGQTSQVLLVVAQKDIVFEHINVARRAGLKVRAVDASPMALLRAVPPPKGGQGLDAVVSVGAQLLVVAVRQGETPRFMRTATIAAEPEPSVARSGVAAVQTLARDQARDNPGSRFSSGRPSPIVEEVRSSIDYFLSHAQGEQLAQVQVTGGGSLSEDLLVRLGGMLGVPVLAASTGVKANPGALGLDSSQFRVAEQRWTTAVGLAQWGLESGTAPSLLPREIGEDTAKRRIIALSAAGVIAVAAGLGYASHTKDSAIAQAKAQARADTNQAAVLEGQIRKLGALSAVKAEEQARRLLATTALSGDIDWVGLERRVEKALPVGVTVTNLSFSATTTSGSGSSGSTGSTPSPYIGQVTMQAQTNRGLPSVAAFVKAMTKVPGLGAVWVPNSSQGAGAGGATLPASAQSFQFSATAEVTPKALSDRASQLPGGTK